MNSQGRKERNHFLTARCESTKSTTVKTKLKNCRSLVQTCEACRVGKAFWDARHPDQRVAQSACKMKMKTRGGELALLNKVCS